MLGAVPETNEDDSLRSDLMRRLTEVVARPSAQGSVQDRAIAGDLLLEMLIDTNDDNAVLCAERLKDSADAPPRLLRYLASREPQVAEGVLRDNNGLTESDLTYVVRHAGSFHRVAIARRRELGPCAADAIVDSGDLEAIAALLTNPTARLSDHAMDGAVGASRQRPSLCAAILDRQEIRPAQALIAFWWCDVAQRRDILLRFSAERQTLISMCVDMFHERGDRHDEDPLVRKTMQFIERRQRNRRALQVSRFGSLEEAVQAARGESLTRELAEEISHLSGIKPLTGAQILADPGGEAVAILCKATGLKRRYLAVLWSAMRRPLGNPGKLNADFERVVTVFDMISLAKAQTVLRYWNWSLSATFSPDFLQGNGFEAPRLGDADFTPSSRASRLVFGRS